MKILILLSFICLTVPAGAADPSRISQVKDLYPHLSPDGSRIVFQSNRSGNAQIWLMNRDGSEVMMLTDVPGEGAETPAWSPDGRLIAYATYVGPDNNDVFVMKADGSEQTRVTSGPGNDGHPHWSADGQRITSQIG